MTLERTGEDKDVLSQYPGVNFAVYNASDFSPRGSLRPVSEIKPPYPISDAPAEYGSVIDIVEAVLRINPKSDLSGLKHFVSQTEDGDTSNKATRQEPEKIHSALDLNLLRQRFGPKKDESGDIFEQGDKIAILWPSDRYLQYYMIVDLKNGKTRYIFSDSTDDETTKTRAIRVKHSNEPKIEIDKPFESTDLIDPQIREANDAGNRKSYPKETENFFNRMRQADLEVEDLLINKMDGIVPISESIKRLARRKGRGYVREELANLRNNSTSGIIDEISEDLLFARKLDKNMKSVTKKDIAESLGLLLETEKFYLGAILDFPWNKIGPEPFDTLIDVFWFRFDFKNLQREWKDRQKRLTDIRSDSYKDAQIERILEWVWKKKGYKCAHLKELKELKIKYNSKRVAKDMGPLYKFVDLKNMKRRIIWEQKQNRPSELTLLLWSTLKWASPSEHMAGHTMNTSDFRLEDPETWEEHFADPFWTNQGDFQGRLVLPGENTPRPLSHLQAGGSTEDEIKKRMYLAAEEYGVEMNVDNQEILVKSINQRLKQKDNISHYESVADNFQAAVSALPLRDVVKKIHKMPSLQKVIALHRLGYRCDIKLKNKEGRERYIGRLMTVQAVIGTFFDGSADRYYKLLSQATKTILM